MTKQILRVLEVVQESPSTSRDVSEELGIPLKSASAELCTLRDLESIELVGRVMCERNGRPLNLYAAKEEAAV